MLFYACTADKVKTALRESCGGSILAVEPSLARDWVKVSVMSVGERIRFVLDVEYCSEYITGGAYKQVCTTAVQGTSVSPCS